MRKQALLSITGLADQDERVVFIGSDLGPGVMAEFKERHSDRFFMEGVSEQHIIGMAAGMAMEGFIPYVNTIATFLTRRCYEQIAMDVCLHDLPVRLIANGGGMVYAPLGPTHQAIDDFALMRALPNMTVTAPVDANEMASLIKASLNYPKPLYVRLGKGGDPIVTSPQEDFNFSQLKVLADGSDIALISTGVVSAIALDASVSLAKAGVSAKVIHVPTVKPIDQAALIRDVGQITLVIVVEEHIEIGGLSSAIGDLFAYGNTNTAPKLLKNTLGDSFNHKYGSQSEHLEAAGITPSLIVKTCLDALTKMRD